MTTSTASSSSGSASALATCHSIVPARSARRAAASICGLTSTPATSRPPRVRLLGARLSSVRSRLVALKLWSRFLGKVHIRQSGRLMDDCGRFDAGNCSRTALPSRMSSAMGSPPSAPTRSARARPAGCSASGAVRPWSRRSAPPRSSTHTATLIPGALVEIIPDCAHFPWLERPDAFRAAVERLLARSA